jgi:hypothetical protein
MGRKATRRRPLSELRREHWHSGGTPCGHACRTTLRGVRRAGLQRSFASLSLPHAVDATCSFQEANVGPAAATVTCQRGAGSSKVPLSEGGLAQAPGSPKSAEWHHASHWETGAGACLPVSRIGSLVTGGQAGQGRYPHDSDPGYHAVGLVKWAGRRTWARCSGPGLRLRDRQAGFIVVCPAASTRRPR